MGGDMIECAEYNINAIEQFYIEGQTVFGCRSPFNLDKYDLKAVDAIYKSVFILNDQRYRLIAIESNAIRFIHLGDKIGLMVEKIEI